MSNLAAVLTVLGSAVIVLTGLAALTRAIFKAASDLRDNKNATINNTHAIGELSRATDGRMTALESRLGMVETILQRMRRFKK